MADERSTMRPLEADFYRDPNGRLVYRWSDERLVVVDSDALESSRASAAAYRDELTEMTKEAQRRMETAKRGNDRHDREIQLRTLDLVAMRFDALCSDTSPASPVGSEEGTNA